MAFMDFFLKVTIPFFSNFKNNSFATKAVIAVVVLAVSLTVYLIFIRECPIGSEKLTKTLYTNEKEEYCKLSGIIKKGYGVKNGLWYLWFRIGRGASLHL